MRYAILIENERVLVEFSEVDFIKLLKHYYNQTNDIDKAMELVKEELTNKVRKL